MASFSKQGKLILTMGLGLLGLSFLLWMILPFSQTEPPYLVTPVLLLSYGSYLIWRTR